MRGSRGLRRLAGAGFGLLAAWVLAELLLRLAGAGERAAVPIHFAGPGGVEASADSLRWDARRFWTLAPGTRFLGRYPVNRLGYRGPDPAGERPLRVLALGDSCTFGIGVPEGRSWPRRLEAILDAVCGEATAAVVAAAVPGYSMFQCLETLRLELPRLDPGVVVLYESAHNDASVAGGVPDEARPLPRPWSSLAGISRVLWLLADRRMRAAREGSVAPRVPPDSCERFLTEAARACAAAGAVFAVVVPPHRESPAGGRPASRSYEPIFGRVASRSGHVRVDPREAFRDWSRSDLWADDIHPSTLGHGLLAWQVARELFVSGTVERCLREREKGEAPLADRAQRFARALLRSPGEALPDGAGPFEGLVEEAAASLPALATLRGLVSPGAASRTGKGVDLEALRRAREASPPSAWLESVLARLESGAGGDVRAAARARARRDALARFLDPPEIAPANGDLTRDALAWHVVDRRLRDAVPVLDRGQREGDTALARGERDAAIEAYEGMLRRGVRPLPAWRGLGRVRLARGELAEAEAAFRRGLALDPEDEGCLRGLGETCFRRGDLAGAEASFRRAAAVSSTAERTQHWLGLIAAREGREEEARSHLRAGGLEGAAIEAVLARASREARRGEGEHEKEVDGKNTEDNGSATPPEPYTPPAPPRLPAIFGNHMVLQQGVPLAVWGWATPGESVEVELAGESIREGPPGGDSPPGGPSGRGRGRARARCVADREGRWFAWLPPQEPGEGMELRVRGAGGERRLRDVACGEVWLASGQSNMEWPLSLATGGEAEAARAFDPGLRLFGVARSVADAPREDLPGAWAACTPEAAGPFSAVAYFFGKELRAALGVPVGILHASWHATFAEAWMSHQALATDPRFAPILARVPALAEDRHEDATGNVRPSKHLPSGLWNAMVAPLARYRLRGFLWYQGESNVRRAWQYRWLFPALIRDWREGFGQGVLPFLFVQLANFRQPYAPPGSWAELREAQARALDLPRTAMVVTIDAGESADIHPRDKRTVGHRLALAALAEVYGRDVVASGPVLRAQIREGDAVRLRFASTEGGLRARGGGALRGFEVAGEDRRFVPARARIEGEDVVVWSPAVPAPRAVRYAWADDPEANLINGAGLPAAPLRTDDWPLRTEGVVEPEDLPERW